MSHTDKRHRVSLACTSCRQRKRRCGGQKPVCMACDRDGRHCEYSQHLEKRKPPTKCYIHALHSRIALLEHRLTHSRDNTEDSPSPFNSRLPLDGFNLSRQIVSEEPPDLLRNPCLTGAYGHPGFFDGYSRSQDTSEPSIHSNYVQESPLSLIQPDQQAELLEEFWTWQNNWPLLIHQPLFQRDLAENGVNGYCKPAVLSAIMSISAQYIDDDQLQLWNVSTDSLTQHAKGLVLGQIERPSLSLTLAAALVSLRELIVDNLASASQYIGIANRHALFLGLHLPTLETGGDMTESNDLKEARSIAWLGTWYLQKHITQVLGQPSTIRDCDIRPIPVPIIPCMEYRPWPIPNSSLILTSHCMTNMQYACDLLRMVSPVLDELYALSSSLKSHENENRVTKTHVAMSEFYNNLPSSLRLPSTSTKPLPPHVYQFNLQYHNLKIMLHRPFITDNPSMEALQDPQSPQMVHLQSATFSAIRISQTINAYRNFYPLHRLSPFTVQSLMMASLIHLFNANSTDTMLAQRSEHLYGLHRHVLSQMASTTRCSARAIQVLDSVRINGGVLGDKGGPELPSAAFQAPESDLAGVAMPVPENTNLQPDAFDWFELPLNNQFLFDGEFADLLSTESFDFEIDQGRSWSLDDEDNRATARFL